MLLRKIINFYRVFANCRKSPKDFPIYVLKNSTCKYTCTVHTCVAQGSTVFPPPNQRPMLFYVCSCYPHVVSTKSHSKCSTNIWTKLMGRGWRVSGGLGQDQKQECVCKLELCTLLWLGCGGGIFFGTSWREICATGQSQAGCSSSLLSVLSPSSPLSWLTLIGFLQCIRHVTLFI